MINRQRGAGTRRAGLVLGVLVFAFGAPALVVDATQAISDSITARARVVEEQLIAPCCFSQTVAYHHSPEAERVKRQVRDMLRAGSSESEIVEFFLEKYGERILAAPRGKGFNLLAYVVPVVALASGFAGVAMLLRRWRRMAAGGAPGAPAASVAATETERKLRERLEAELAGLDL